MRGILTGFAGRIRSINPPSGRPQGAKPTVLLAHLVRSALGTGRNVLAAIVVNLVLCDLLFDISERRNFGTGLWWLFTTWSTTGYGDVTPVSWLGRVAAIYLMVSNTLLMLLATAHLTSWVIIDLNEWTDKEQKRLFRALTGLARALGKLHNTAKENLAVANDTEHKIIALTAEVRALHREVAQLEQLRANQALLMQHFGVTPAPLPAAPPAEH